MKAWKWIAHMMEKKALSMARENEYDMVLLDLMLPKLRNGLGVCQQIRDFSSVPIIMLTAKGRRYG